VETNSMTGPLWTGCVEVGVDDIAARCTLPEGPADGAKRASGREAGVSEGARAAMHHAR
jgi:hypothetical protein